MSKKSIYLFLSLFIVIVIGMFAFTAIQKRQLTNLDPVPTSHNSTTATNYNINRIDGKHYFINGLHTIVGEITMPTPCDLLSTKAEVLESNPPVIKFNFIVVNNSKDCPKIMTAMRFKISATSTNNANLEAYFFEKKVELNLVEAGAGEKPDEFELFIKG